LDRLSQADVDDHLLESRDLHRVGIAELAPQRRRHLVEVSPAEAPRRRLNPRWSLHRLGRLAPELTSRLLGLGLGRLVGHEATSICSPQCLQTRTWRAPPSR